MASNLSQEEQDIYSISVMPDEGYACPDSSSDFSFLSVIEVPDPSKNEMCLDAINCQSCVNLQMDNTNDYPPCIVDIDIKNEKPETPKPVEEAAATMKIEGVLPRILRRQESVKLGENFMQVLLDQGSILLNSILRDKPVTERVHDTQNNKWRRYKRAASFDSRKISFDSRKIVLLFSILSSFGTLVLIYLTLRVRQAGDAFVSS